jgi:hypothetical protein
MQFLFSGYLSYNAYYNWQDDPIITTVSTTALPINNLEYPAITICGQVSPSSPIWKSENFICQTMVTTSKF